ncbi:BlaI/MecI/CopY family transcriptional regulator [Kitasatospora sp. NPDC002040]|uniref:BlaI/MecI/CopY family transcriptional regulator n=1 Tax=Kitasatospora sp. NPDC002040 TaxID=3154661 RepID=UPI0033181C42
MAHNGSVPDQSDRPPRRAQGELETQVLQVLNRAGEPVSAMWVQEQFEDLTYSTVITILTRLHDKLAVTRVRDGRSYQWSPTADGAGLAALRMRRMLDGERDRQAVLASFVTALSADDEQLIRGLLGEGVPQPGAGGGG